jgi:hypothetical protein
MKRLFLILFLCCFLIYSCSSNKDSTGKAAKYIVNIENEGLKKFDLGINISKRFFTEYKGIL